LGVYHGTFAGKSFLRDLFCGAPRECIIENLAGVNPKKFIPTKNPAKGTKLLVHNYRSYLSSTLLEVFKDHSEPEKEKVGKGSNESKTTQISGEFYCHGVELKILFD